MNCVCGHEYDLRHWEDGYNKKDDFIDLGITNQIKVFIPKTNLYENDRNVGIYACPKCYTVRIDEV